MPLSHGPLQAELEVQSELSRARTPKFSKTEGRLLRTSSTEESCVFQRKVRKISYELWHEAVRLQRKGDERQRDEMKAVQDSHRKRCRYIKLQDLFCGPASEKSTEVLQFRTENP